MTVTFILGLGMCALSPTLMRFRYGRQWLLRPFGILTLMGFIYHGASEVVIRITDSDELGSYRVNRDWAAEGMFTAGLALLALTLGYIAATGNRPLPASSDLTTIKRSFDWRVTGALSVPLFAATVAGQGYASGAVLEGGGLNTPGFATQFFVTLILLTSFGLLVRYPNKFLLIVGGQSVLIAIAGQRLEIFIAATVLWVPATRVGVGPARKQVVAAVLVAGLAGFAISSVRGAGGRDLFYSDSGFSARVEALWKGITEPEDVESVNGGSLLQEAFIRLESNNWTGSVEQAFQSHNADPIGARPLWNAVLTNIPSFLFPDKVTSLSLAERSVEYSQIMGLPLVDIDYLSGHATSFLGLFGKPGMLFWNFGFGAVLALLERLAGRSGGVAGVVFTLALTQAALFYERGQDYYLTLGRAALVIVIALWAWGRLAAALARPEKKERPPPQSSVWKQRSRA